MRILIRFEYNTYISRLHDAQIVGLRRSHQIGLQFSFSPGSLSAQNFDLLVEVRDPRINLFEFIEQVVALSVIHPSSPSFVPTFVIPSLFVRLERSPGLKERWVNYARSSGRLSRIATDSSMTLATFPARALGGSLGSALQVPALCPARSENWPRADLSNFLWRTILSESKQKLSVLHVSHCDIHKQLRGGIEAHVRDLILHYRKSRPVFHYFRRGNSLILRAYREKVILERRTPVNEGLEQDLDSPSIDRRFRQILKETSAKVVHIHSFLNLPFSFIQSAKDLSRKVVFTVHDFHVFCQRYDLIDSKGRYCGFESRPGRCLACVSREAPTPQRYLLTENFLRDPIGRRRQVLARIEGGQVIFPDQSVKDLLAKAAPALSSKNITHVLPHPLPTWIGPSNRSRDHVEPKPPRPLRGLFLGEFNQKKGALLFSDLIRAIPLELRSRFEFHVLGRIDEPALALELMDKYGIKFLGPYGQKDLAGALKTREFDFGLVLSIWPETYSYTLSELWRAGLPVIATNLGAQAARVRKSQGPGWIVSMNNSAPDFLRILNDFEALKAAIPKGPVVNSGLPSKDFFRQLDGIYEAPLFSSSVAAPGGFISDFAVET